MKPTLIIGLGNPLMGDDGVGCRVAECLAVDPRLPEDAEVIAGGTDVLRLAETMQGRQRIVLLDAMLDAGLPGDVAIVETAAAGGHAHHLSAAECVGLLRAVTPALAGVRFTVLAIAVESAHPGGLSPALARRVPEIAGRVLRELAS
ncbi:MAG: hydrogenase maturation protease [Bryobacteraceae bacterium]